MNLWEEIINEEKINGIINGFIIRFINGRMRDKG